VLLPKATFSIQVLAPFFVVLKKFLHHFSQCTLIQLRKKNAQGYSDFGTQTRLKANRKKRGTRKKRISSAPITGLR
jgi:hypothetical protein